MTGRLPYVKVRDGVFQFERRVPKAVLDRPAQFQAIFGGKLLFRRSLRTKDRSVALRALASANDDFEALVARATGKVIPPRSSERSLRKVVQADLDAIASRYRAVVANPFERAQALAGSSPTYADDLDRMTCELETYAEEILASIDSNRPSMGAASFRSPVDMAQDVIKLGGFDASPGSEERGLVVNAIRAGLKQGYKRVEALASGEALAVLPTAIKSRPAITGLTIREAVEQHQDFKKVHAKQRSEAKLSLRIFEELIGNKYLEEITKADFRVFVEHLSGLHVGAKSASSIMRPLAMGTVKKRVGIFSAAINHAEDRGHFSGKNPAAGIKLTAWIAPQDKRIMPDKRPFKVHELAKVFGHPWFTGCESEKATHRPGRFLLQGSEYWVPVVALYTGCRASELGGMKLSEVLIDGPWPHLVVRHNEYRQIKSGKARNVPILDALISRGFLEYVKRVAEDGATRLFPDWKPPKGLEDNGALASADAAWANCRVIRAFNRTVVPSMLIDSLSLNVRQEVTFHNLRGSFKTMLSTSSFAINRNIIDDVLGHEKTGMDSRYIGTMAIEETYRAIHKCDFMNLPISSRV